MSSRDDILRTIRRQLPLSSPIPDGEFWGARYDDPVQQFFQVLESVGGQGHLVADPARISEHLEQRRIPGQRLLSAVPGVLEPVFDFTTVTDPHSLADVELAVIPGVMAVAENAGVWVETDSAAVRTACFLSQHLVLVVPASHLVHNLHEAYSQLRIGENRFGCWISGPSKTADIEQSLVKGAHGARTLNVFLVES